MLDFSRFETNSAQLEIAPFDVRRLIRSVYQQYTILLKRFGMLFRWATRRCIAVQVLDNSDSTRFVFPLQIV